MATIVPKQDAEKVSIHENEASKTPADPTLQIYIEFAGRDAEWKALHTKRLVRKLDFRVLPLLTLMFLLNFLDRGNIAQARLGTLEKDLGMKGTDFNLATSILFIGYVTMQLPSNLVITRVRPSIYLGVVMAIWGTISAAQASVHSFGSLLACRIMLGVIEAPFFPGAIFLMSSWYTRAELAQRVALFYGGNILGNMFGGLLGAAVLGNMNGTHGIAGWRWLFIIEGVITIAVSLIATMILPDFPATTRWLSQEERHFAQWRLIDDAKDNDDTKAVSLLTGLKLAFRNYRLYLFILLQHLSLLTQTFQYFFPSIVNTLGFNNITTLLLTVPVWGLTMIASLIVTYTSGRTGDRSIHIICLMAISCIGNIIVVSTLNTGARFFAMFLMPLGAVPAYQIILTWVANSFYRPLVTRSASIAVCNLIGSMSSIYGSYIYPSSDAPRYLPGGSAIAVLCLVTAGVALIIRVLLGKENARLEREEAVEASATEAAVVHSSFRYIL